ncbi:sulfotransferase domain-containing protein [Rubrobacter taiwanensis]|jgi:aryl sulfotransferase|uniref:Sulfotransferase domain-containing protein n=1 Tax=Rubrobacter taiwanensis TaxID=185139 RepID=A0A4V2NWS8_9ACTN|nr:sulfotransferase domain-containing protein [Rubrobacter taiwanensis]TCJ18482.1 sulfotransferase domain-containing protein [Rubrobacter taiwanensis]
MRPQQRIYRSATTDGTRWAAYKHRPGDIFICTPPKCGTTWMQTIVASLLWPDGDFPGVVMEVGPWFDGLIYDFDELLARLEAQTHRRYIKTHTPADGIPIFDTASYIVVGRDGRDAFVSLANHMARMRADVRGRLDARAAAQGVPKMMEFRGDIHEFFERWLSDTPLLHHIASWWDLRGEPNVLLVHYNDLKADLDREMRRVAAFLKIDVSASLWPEVVKRCTFESMRANPDRVGDFGSLFEGGAGAFLFKGTNGRWRKMLTEAELRRYRHRVEELLTPEAACWLEHGSRSGIVPSSMPAGDP